MAADSMEIDDSLYSRQRYVLGDRAMHQMAQSSVFLSGMGGLGIEIAKNIVLAGVKAVTLHDTKQCETCDLGSNFFIHKEDVSGQKSKVEAVCARVAELNPYVHVDVSSLALDDGTDLGFLVKYQARLRFLEPVVVFFHGERRLLFTALLRSARAPTHSRRPKAPAAFKLRCSLLSPAVCDSD